MSPLLSHLNTFCVLQEAEAEDSRACFGHSWNQLMAVQFTMSGNFLLRTLSLGPTGEKQRVT